MWHGSKVKVLIHCEFIYFNCMPRTRRRRCGERMRKWMSDIANEVKLKQHTEVNEDTEVAEQLVGNKTHENENKCTTHKFLQ